jgi:hypothetical protein
MSGPTTIEGDIQEIILQVLPDDGALALDVMAQLSANMIMSIKGADIESYVQNLRAQYSAYQRANA